MLIIASLINKIKIFSFFIRQYSIQHYYLNNIIKITKENSKFSNLDIKIL